VGPASKRQGPLFGRDPKESSRVLCGTLFWEEPEKQRAAVPQDAGKTPSVCPSQRRAPTAGATSTGEKRLSGQTINLRVRCNACQLRLHRSLTERNQRIPEGQQLRATVLRSPCKRGLKLHGTSQWLVHDIVSPQTPRRASHQTDTAMKSQVIQQLDQIGNQDNRGSSNACL
jgi:hypothetical protein